MARIVKNLVVSVCFGLIGVNAHAAQDVCKNLAGKTVFVDMLYGMAGGLLSAGYTWLRMITTKKETAKQLTGLWPGAPLGLESVLRRFFQESARQKVKTSQLQIDLRTTSGFLPHQLQHLPTHYLDSLSVETSSSPKKISKGPA